jgi:hypothetical protein
MSTQQDSSIGVALEPSFGTLTTPNHFYEFLTETFNWVPTFTMNNGQRVGRILQRVDRRVLTKEESTGELDIEGFTKGLGFLFNAALGTATSTLVSGSAYQQLITPATSDYLNSYTIQKGIPPLGGGAASPQTYVGMVCNGFTITASNAGIPTLKFPFLGKSMDTSTALTAPSYITNNQVWSFKDASIQIGGTLTLPTATTLATGGTSVADIVDVNLTWNNVLDGGGFNLGGNGQRSRKPAMTDRVATGSMTAEFDSTVMIAAWRNQTPLALVLNFVSTVAPISGAIYPTLQVTCPAIVLNGEMPKANAGKVITQTIPFDVMDNGVAPSSLYVAVVTAETAL